MNPSKLKLSILSGILIFLFNFRQVSEAVITYIQEVLIHFFKNPVLSGTLFPVRRHRLFQVRQVHSRLFQRRDAYRQIINNPMGTVISG